MRALTSACSGRRSAPSLMPGVSQTECLMRRYVLCALVLLVAVIAVGCRETDGPPAPPEAPDLTGRVPPKLPGSDDYARRSFAYPLSVQDAEVILRHTQVFEFGGMPPKRQVQAFNVVFEQRDAVSRFHDLGDAAWPAGKLYALAGLLLLDRTAAARLQRSLAEDSKAIMVFDSDVVYEKPVRDLAVMVEQRDMGTWFRRVRDETNAHYAKSP
jgi:hypothetical protein